MQQEHVQLVVSGNSHNYERSYALTNGVPASGGVTYVVSGGGGNGFNQFAIAQPAWSAFREDTFYEYVHVTVSSSTLQLQAVNASDGIVLDSASLSSP